MLLTIFLAIVFCVAITNMMFAAVVFIQDKKLFSSAPKEFQKVIVPREKELFYGAKAIGWALLVFSFILILGVGVISVWDGLRSEYSFWQFFFPEIEDVAQGRKYGYNIKSQLIKLLIIFPAASALVAWICSGLR